MLKIIKYLGRKELIQIAVAVVFIVSQVWLDLKIPEYMSEVTVLVQTPGSTVADIWHEGQFMLLCALGSIIAAIIVGFLAARVAASFAQQLRSRMFRRVDDFSMEEINRFSIASLITRSTNDVTQVQMFITMGLQIMVKAPIMAVWAMSKIYGKGTEWTIATGVAVLILVIMIGLVTLIVMPKFRMMQELTDNINKVTRENLIGLRDIRAYNAEDYQQNKFTLANDALTNTHLFTSRAMAMIMPMMAIMMSGISLAIYWIGAYMINGASAGDRLTIFSNMVVFSSYAMQVIMSFMMMSMIFMMMPRATVAAKRINEVLDTLPTILDGSYQSLAKSGTGVTKAKINKDLAGQVVFENVYFKFPDAADYVLEDISFTANPGETVAFIGSTGSGKTSLVNLIPRFYDVTEGRVLVSGLDVRDYPKADLFDKIGYVPQRAVVFSGTLASNVAYGERGGQAPSMDEVKEAVAIAQSQDFVEKLDGAYEAEIAQEGKNLSGGQRQRISIARAIARRPEIYIFDDSFSALDYKTDRKLRTALRQETAGVTSLIVAQRIGTIMDADQIFVLDEGRIVGRGQHRDLLKSCQVYREIAMSQLSEEELANA